MEENVNEVLGVEQPQATPEVPEVKEENVEKLDNSAENTLSIIATIILILGIIGTLICLFTLCFVELEKGRYFSYTETVFNPSGFATTIMVLLSTLISWSVMKVLANISITLKKINNKIK